MQRNRYPTFGVQVLEATVLIFMLLLAIGCWSQQPAPAATAYAQLHAQFVALNKAYWDAPTLEEKDAIWPRLEALDNELTEMNRAQLTRNTDAFAKLTMDFAVATLVTQPATATYRTNGPAVLNDLTVTPGAAGSTPQATLCSPSFHTGTVRNVPESVKQKVCRAYGIARADCVGTKVEIDHLISLELGGTNDPANLWPQPYFPRPGAKEKDVVENWLHRQVCTNAMPLADAQHAIATDWYQVYLTVPKANGGGGQ